MPGPAPAVAATRLAVRQALRDGWAAPPKGRDLAPRDEVSPEGRDLALHDASTCDVPEGRDSASRRARPPRPTKDETTIVEGGGDLPPRAAPGGPHDGLVLVACSGGPDSLALAAATAFVAPRLGWRAGAVVVDHGLQDGSAQVAARAAEQCRGLGLDPVLVRPVQVGTEGGPEAAARTARYAALEAAAAALGADVVLLGHTLDDQAEQVLLALARGSGARSLAGMPDRRGIYRRPFLGLGRAVTSAACAAQDLTPWDDPTNSTGAGRRTRVRTEVMPLLVDVLGPGVVPALARTADQLRDAADAVDDAATALLATSRADDGSVPVEALAQAPAAVRRAALRILALAAGSPAGSLGARHVAAVEALVVDWHGQGPIHLPGAVMARRDCGRLRVVPGATSAGPTSAGHQTRADG